MHQQKLPLAVSQQEKHTLTAHTLIQSLIILIMAVFICACQSVPTVPTAPQPQITVQPQHIPTETASQQEDQTSASTTNSTEPYTAPPHTNIQENKVSTVQKSAISSTSTTSTTGLESPTPSSPAQSPSSPDSSILTQPTTETPIPEQPSRTSIEPQKTEAATAPVVIVTIPKPDPETTRQILLERARENSQNSAAQTRTLNTGDNLPAFRQLMDIGVSQLQANQLNAAENSFTRAQRLAPQSSAVYFYLGQVALKKNQPRKAEAMARRGLIVAQSPERRRALWQIILRSGQRQNNPRVIQEAQNALR